MWEGVWAQILKSLVGVLGSAPIYAESGSGGVGAQMLRCMHIANGLAVIYEG